MSIFIITLAGGAAFSLIQQNFNLWRSASSSLQAIYMAQEALEVARNIRDGNYLEQRAQQQIKWDDGIPSQRGCLAARVPPCDYYGDVNTDGIVSVEDAKLIANYLSGLTTLEDFQKERADVIESYGNITITDASHIVQYAACNRQTLNVCGTSKAKFKREVIISKNGDVIDVAANVSWKSAGGTQNISILDRLNKWR